MRAAAPLIPFLVAWHVAVCCVLDLPVNSELANVMASGVGPVAALFEQDDGLHVVGPSLQSVGSAPAVALLTGLQVALLL
jgi:hypothetical protein